MELWDRTIVALKGWWRDWWLRVSILLLLAVVGLLLSLWWFVGERTGTGGDVLLRFFDSLVGIAAVCFGGAVTIATIYSATRVARGVALTEQRECAERLERRKARLEALVGATLEAGWYAGSIAELQHRGLKRWRRLVPESVAEREFTLAAWRHVSSAGVSASKALERIRFEDPDIAAVAGEHYDLLLNLQALAFEGRIEDLQEQAERIRVSADALWRAV